MAGHNTTEIVTLKAGALKSILHSAENTNNVSAPIALVCQHGEGECEGNEWESCVQDVSTSPEESFAVFECIEGKFCDEAQGGGMFPNPECDEAPGDTAYNCVKDKGRNIDQAALVQCFQDKTKITELLVMNDIATLDVDIKWVPWFTVDGQSIVEVTKKSDMSMTSTAFREQFLLGKKICDAFVAKTGKKAPEGCLAFPHQDSELGEDPWTFFNTTNFTALVAKHKQQELESSQEITLGVTGAQALVNNLHQFNFIASSSVVTFNLFALVLFVVLVVAVFYYCVPKAQEQRSVSGSGLGLSPKGTPKGTPKASPKASPRKTPREIKGSVTFAPEEEQGLLAKSDP